MNKCRGKLSSDDIVMVSWSSDSILSRFLHTWSTPEVVAKNIHTSEAKAKSSYPQIY